MTCVYIWSETLPVGHHDPYREARALEKRSRHGTVGVSTDQVCHCFRVGGFAVTGKGAVRQDK